VEVVNPGAPPQSSTSRPFSVATSCPNPPPTCP
jgi:hypothetical protein